MSERGTNFDVASRQHEADPLMDRKAAAKELGISLNTLRRREAAGLIPPPDRRAGTHGRHEWRRSTLSRVKAPTHKAAEYISAPEVAASLGLTSRAVDERVTLGWLPPPDLPGRQGVPHRWLRATLEAFHTAEKADPLVDAETFASRLGISRGRLTARVKSGLVPPPDRRAGQHGGDQWRRSTILSVLKAGVAGRRRAW